jgi:hypothetical protein
MFDGVSTGTQLPGFIAGEVDYVWPDLYKQPGLTTLATGTGTCRSNGRATPMHVTAYTATSGARVLNGSTFAYGCFLVRRCPTNWTVPAPDDASQRAVATMVGNITEWVSRGTIDVPADTTAATVRVAVPKHKLETATQP